MRVVHGVVHVNTREDLCDIDFVRGAADTDGLRCLRLNNSRRDQLGAIRKFASGDHVAAGSSMLGSRTILDESRESRLKEQTQ